MNMFMCQGSELCSQVDSLGGQRSYGLFALGIKRQVGIEILLPPVGEPDQSWSYFWVAALWAYRRGSSLKAGVE